MLISRPLQYALALWLALGVALTIRTLHRPGSHTNFPLFACGADHFWNDQPLYARYEALDYFRYPPPAALLFTPFARVGLVAGGILWAWVSLIVYGAGFWSFARHVLPVRWSDTRLAVYLGLGLLGGLRGLWNGQSNALIVGLLLLGIAALARQRWWHSALLLAAATAIKPITLAVVLLLVVLQPLRLGPRLAVLLLIFFAVPFAARPAATVMTHYHDWIEHVSATGSERWPGFRDAWTVWLVALHTSAGEPGLPALTEPLKSPAYRTVQLTAAAAALLWCLWLRRREHDTRARLAQVASIGLAWSMLFGPAVEHATYVFMAAVLGWAMLDETSAWRRALAWTSGGMILLLGWGSLTDPLLDVMPWLFVTLPIGTAAFVVWLMVRRSALREVKTPALSPQQPALRAA
jgi:hypothetical protein